MAVELRIALLLIGIAVLVALYFLGKFKWTARRHENDEFNFETNELPDPLELDQALELGRYKEKDKDKDEEVQEELNDLSNLVRKDIADSPRIKKSTFKHQPSLLNEQEPEESKQEVKLVVLHVVARHPQKFKGKGIVNLVKELGLEYDNMRVFHKNVERFSGKKALYSIVNIVKPGTFDLNAMDEFDTPGLSFVMNLPGPEEGLKAFNIMLEAARKFADRLNGDLLDESRSRLSPQTIAHLQEEVQLFSLKFSRRA